MMEIEYLIRNAIAINDPQMGEFTPQASVFVSGGKIAAVGSYDALRAASPQAEVIDGSGCLLLPGLVDAHTHLYGALIAAMPAPKTALKRFADVLEYVWWVWDRNLTVADVIASAQVGCAASVRAGITTIFDHHASPRAVEGSLSTLAAQIGRTGLRACLAYEVSDRNGVDDFEAGVAENIRFSRQIAAHPGNMLRAMFGLHAVFSLSDGSLRRCGQAAAELGIGCHLHVAEHRDEVARFAEKHSQHIPAFLADIGILSPKSLLAHTVHVDTADILTMKAGGTYNAHNPQSNLSNGVGIAPVLEMLTRGQKVCLGSDGFFNLAHQVGLAQMMQTTASGVPGALSDRQALSMLYGNNIQMAEEVFDCRMGKIREGYTADLILVKYEPLIPLSQNTVHSETLRALQSGRVTTVMVDGSLVMLNDVLMGMDESEIDYNARAAAAGIHERLS